MTPAKPPFPHWVILGGLLLAAGYLPTLATPFDFTDDGNLVYPTRGLSAGQHVSLWWDKVKANVEHLGPFRPVVWAHWQLAANVYGDNPTAWRAGRVVWCGLAAVMLLWLMRELKLPPVAALVAAAAAMWNPYRNEIWTSLTLAEGVAMPYALFALVAARKAATADRRRWAWDFGAVAGLLLALGCKNTFVALIPPMILLRAWGVGGLRAKVLPAAGYMLPAALAVGHLVYLKFHPGPCHYETPGPSWHQACEFASWLKGTAGVDFLGVGVLAVAGAVGWERYKTRRRGVEETRRESVSPSLPVSPSPHLAPAFGLLLLLSGFIVYLPVDIMCGRYTMPAVWGVDVLFAVLLGRFIALPASWPKRAAWAAVGVGMAALVIAGAGRQEKVAARSRMLWQLLDRVEKTAPNGAVAQWVSGNSEDGELNAEEGIHFYWHLLHRGRADVRVRLIDAAGEPVYRVELPSPPGPTRYRIAAHPSEDKAWRTTADVSVPYHFGRRTFTGSVQEPALPPNPPPSTDELTEKMLRETLGGFDPVKKLLDQTAPGGPGVAERPGTKPR